MRAGGGDEVGPDLFEQVVAETLAPGAEPASTQERAALIDVARRHPGSTVDQEPVVQELVLAILKERFNRLELTPEDWQAMARTVAATLLEAPNTHARLQSLWSHLCQSAV